MTRCNVLLGVLLAMLPGSRAAADETISWQQHVAPLLTRYCAGCHNSTDAEAGLSLQTPAELKKGGDQGPVLDPAKPADSLLYRVLSATGDEHMPPLDEPQLTPAELKLLQSWILAGAAFDGPPIAMLAVPKIHPVSDNAEPAIFSLAVSADGSLVANGMFRSIQLKDREGRQQEFSVADGKVTDLVLESSGETLLAATGIAGFSGRTLRMNLTDGSILTEFAGHSDMVYAVAATHDSSLVATAGYDRRILMHDSRSGELIRTLSGHNGAVFDLAFSPDGQILASASADSTIKVWNAQTGERLDTMSQPQAEQYACVFSPDGQFLYAAGGDNRIRQWRVESRAAARINPLLEARFAHEATIHALVISADGRALATAAEDGSLKIWHADSLTQLASHQLPDAQLTSLTFDPASGEVLAGTSTGDVRRFAVPPTSATAAPAMTRSEISAAQAATPELPDSAAVPEQVAEQEPNNLPDQAQVIQVPVTVSGTISTAKESAEASATEADVDVFRFSAQAGKPILVEVRAARDKSPLDSLVRVLTLDGQPILQTQLQAVRDSYFTFRGKDSDTSDDFRMFNWQEMDLNEYLYADGEVVRLWLYPRGPDSGFKVYPGFGKRFTYFGTTPTSHALQAPAFIVRPHPPGDEFADNGLPVFPVYFENDDDPLREWGSDSRLMFTPPADGEFLVQLTDARGFGGDDFRYQLTLRPPRPDFGITIGGQKVALQPGTGREITFTASRIDAFDGPIEISVENLPPGFSSSLPTEIEQDQLQAFATLLADSNAVSPTAEQISGIRFQARGIVNGKPVTHEIGGLTELTVATDPKIDVTLHAIDESGDVSVDPAAELTVIAGRTTRALLRVNRKQFEGNVEFGKEDAGRNLPHGVYVDNIGLNGLMLLPGQTEREVFITVAGWVPETSRTFYLKSSVDGITSQPVVLHVRHGQAP